MNVQGTIATLVVSIAAVAGVMWLAGNWEAGDQPQTPNPAQDPELEISETGPWPKVVVPEGRQFEFGEMAMGDTRSHKFIIRNDGEVPLQIRKGDTTCKCTLSSLEKDELPPGEEVVVELEWTPKAPQAEFRQQAMLKTNDPENEIVQLEIVGMVVEVLTVVPDDSWKVGPIPGDDPRLVEGEVYSRILTEFQITGSKASVDNITVETKPLTAKRLLELQAKCGYQIIVRVAPPKTAGRFRESIELTTNLEKYPTIQREVQYERAGPVRLLPHYDPKVAPRVEFDTDVPYINLGTFDSDEGRTGQFAILATLQPGQEFEITDIETEIDNFDAAFIDVSVAPDTNRAGLKKFIVTVTVKPGAPIGSHQAKQAAKILLKTSLEEMPEIKVYLPFVVL